MRFLFFPFTLPFPFPFLFFLKLWDQIYFPTIHSSYLFSGVYNVPSILKVFQCRIWKAAQNIYEIIIVTRFPIFAHHGPLFLLPFHLSPLLFSLYIFSSPLVKPAPGEFSIFIHLCLSNFYLFNSNFFLLYFITFI